MNKVVCLWLTFSCLEVWSSFSSQWGSSLVNLIPAFHQTGWGQGDGTQTSFQRMVAPLGRCTGRLHKESECYRDHGYKIKRGWHLSQKVFLIWGSSRLGAHEKAWEQKCKGSWVGAEEDTKHNGGEVWEGTRLGSTHGRSVKERHGKLRRASHWNWIYFEFIGEKEQVTYFTKRGCGQSFGKEM